MNQMVTEIDMSNEYLFAWLVLEKCFPKSGPRTKSPNFCNLIRKINFYVKIAKYHQPI